MKSLYVVASISLLALSSVVLAEAGVSDKAGFFSEQTVQQANQTIQEIKNKHRKDIVVDTLPAIPEDKRALYSEGAKNSFFANWLRERARAARVDGVYILITREPAHLQVGISGNTAREGFGTYDRDRVRNTLLEHFRKKQFDQGLISALQTISSTFDEHSRTFAATARPENRSAGETASRGGTSERPVDTTYRPPAQAPQKTGWSWFTWALVLGGGYLLLRFFLNRMNRSSVAAGNAPGTYNQPGTPGSPGQSPGGPFGGGGGGGGFGRGMFGGLFGGLAGSWLGNRIFGHGSEAPQRQNPPDYPPAQEDPGRFESSGGDFDSDDTGGDVGDSGGDSDGGGDF
ncbi:MAG TPA: TPM domain-containing protein [Planctomycetota bacterium]|nr:TPM domain-containing protein [Planctomycetota bacterium]